MASIIGKLIQGASLFKAGKSLITEKNKTRIGEVAIDVSINEIIEYGSQITEHPIEGGSVISDHIFKEPLKIKIEGHITDTPMRIFGLVETPLQNNSLDSLRSNLTSMLPFIEEEKPSERAYKALKALYTDRSLVSVVMKLETFSDMAITALRFTNDTDTGGKLSFSAELKQVVYSTVKTTLNVHPENTRVARTTSPVNNKGVVDKKEEPQTKQEAAGERRESIIFELSKMTSNALMMLRR